MGYSAMVTGYPAKKIEYLANVTRYGDIRPYTKKIADIRLRNHIAGLIPKKTGYPLHVCKDNLWSFCLIKDVMPRALVEIFKR